jgi:hypothetical protein
MHRLNVCLALVFASASLILAFISGMAMAVQYIELTVLLTFVTAALSALVALGFAKQAGRGIPLLDDQLPDGKRFMVVEEHKGKQLRFIQDQAREVCACAFREPPPSSFTVKRRAEVFSYFGPTNDFVPN